MRATLVDQLPAALADDGFLRRFLGIFDELNETVQLGVDGIEHLADPTVAPPELVRWLGGWLAVESIDPSSPELRQRARVMALGRLLWWRGTAAGLCGLLELLTGGPADVVDSGGVFARGHAPENPRTVTVRVDRAGWTTEDHLLAVVRAEVPADVSFELVVGGHVLWPPRRVDGGANGQGRVNRARTAGARSARAGARH
ncbi:MAG: phage tail protein [Acidimicrobiales bacterium]